MHEDKAHNVTADKRYTIIIDVKGETKPFIRPPQCGNDHIHHQEDTISQTISEEV